MAKPAVGSLVALADGRTVTVKSYAFGKADVASESGAVFRVAVEDMTPIGEAPVQDSAPTDQTVTEGMLSAILGIIGEAPDTGQRDFPGWHLVKALRRGTFEGQRSQAAEYKSLGYTVLSEDPLVTGHEDLVLMGVPQEVWEHLCRKLDEKTNGWRKTRKKREGDRTVEYEESDKRTLETVSAGWSG